MAIKGFMAKAERESTSSPEAPRPAPAPAPAAPAPRAVSPTTSVDASSELEGRLRCKQTLRIDGYVKGEIECDQAVLVGEEARIFASITADEVQVAGIVEGDVVARRKITLSRTAVVVGDLTTPGIVIEEGARLKGQIVIGSDVEADVDAAVKPGSQRGPRKGRPPEKGSAPAPKSGDAATTQPVAAASA
jgi:cytoskeletal protein CcmA (bactofilin family)